MIRRDDRSPDHREPLPAGMFDPDLIELDRRLAERAGAESPPADLAQRVFDVSAAGLVSTPPLVLAKIAPARDRRSLWAGRMALAASVAGAIALGAWALRTGPGATNGPGTLVADASSFDDVPWHVADEIIAVHREVDDLFRVERINSARDLKVEFAQLFPEVEF